MSLSKKSLESLKKLGIIISDSGVNVLGVDMKALSDAIASKEEVEFEAKIQTPDNYHFIDDTQLEDLKKAAKEEGKTSTEKSLPEIYAKAYKDEYGIKLDTKDLKEVVKAIALASGEEAVKKAGLSVQEQVTLITQQKDKDIETLRNNYKELETKFSEQESEAKRWKSEVETINENNDFARLLGNKFNPLLRPSEYRQRMLEEEGFGFKKINGVWKVVDSEGNVKKDKLLQELDPTKTIDSIISKRKEWSIPASGGNGGGSGSGHGTGNSGGGSGGSGNSDDGKLTISSVKNMSQFKELATSEKWNYRDRQVNYNKVIAENKDFNPNE